MLATSNIITLRNGFYIEEQQSLRIKRGAKDNRSEIRVASSELLFLQITQSSKKNLIGKTMACKAVNASEQSIMFLVEDSIPVESLLDLWVDDLPRHGKYFLSGVVCRTQKAGTVSRLIGVRLQAGPATDIQHWKDAHQPL
jgi:hypothetical protein